MDGKLSAPRLWLGTLVALALAACHTIAGIEERRLDPKLDDPMTGSSGAGGEPAAPEPSAACKNYCTTVMAACTGKNAVYTTDELCLGICMALDPGQAEEPVGNTLACRARHAKAAELEPEESCRSAGPGGDGECGSDCEAYCDLYAKLCADDNQYGTLEACAKGCSGLTDQRRYDVIADHEGDTIECRLVHVSSAAVKAKAAEHCPHSRVVPTQPWCIGKADDSPTCEEYCNIQLAACDGALTQYESREQCLDVCGALELGPNSDITGNTVACRRYHSFSSTLIPEQHCAHSGPAGDGHCGDTSKIDAGHTGNCESYCTLLPTACPAQFDAEMGDAEQCMATCIGLDEADPESKYTLAKAKVSSGLSCRILYSARALADDTACAAAVGGDPCQ